MYHIKDDKRSIQSGEMIYQALSRLMREIIFENISVTTLVKEAQVSRATFYRNFDTKTDVLRLKSDRTFQNLVEYLITYYNKNKVERSSAFVMPFLMFFDDNTLIVEQLIDANRTDILFDSLKNVFERFKSSYEKAAKSPRETWDYFVAIRTGVTINILIQWVKSGKKISASELGTLLAQELKSSFTVDQFI